MLSQIDLVEQHEEFSRVVGGQEGFFLGGEVLGGIDEAHAQIGLGEGAAGAADAFLFNFAGGVAQTGGIHELQGIAVEDDGFLDGVAGSAGVGGDDGAVAAGQEVQKGGFADVGGAGDDDAGAVAQDVALVPGVQQGLDFAGNGRQTAANLVWNRLRQFIIRKIEHGLDVGRNGEQGVVKRADPAAEGVFELGGGEPRGAFGTGLDEVEDGLGLGEVDLSV